MEKIAKIEKRAKIANKSREGALLPGAAEHLLNYHH